MRIERLEITGGELTITRFVDRIVYGAPAPSDALERRGDQRHRYAGCGETTRDLQRDLRLVREQRPCRLETRRRCRRDFCLHVFCGSTAMQAVARRTRAGT